jgi:hypothetical protein
VRELWAALTGREPQQRALPPAVEQAAAPKPAA